MVTTVESRLMLTRDARLQIPEQVVTRQVGDETVLLNLESGTYFGLDPVGSRFLELLEAEGTLAAVLAKMLEEFDVTEAQLEADLLRLADEMLASGLLVTA
ncbi:MAG: PqqD family protein [Candidatus Competibacteraceae bacterium]